MLKIVAKAEAGVEARLGKAAMAPALLTRMSIVRPGKAERVAVMMSVPKVGLLASACTAVAATPRAWIAETVFWAACLLVL
jgi:hypothetical protein